MTELNKRHAHQDNPAGASQYIQPYHFDGSHFTEGVAQINVWYDAAVNLAKPLQSNQLAEKFGNILHAIQDFYAHSNWVELQEAKRLTADTLLDTGLEKLKSITPYSANDGVMFVEGDPPAGYSLSRAGAVIEVQTSDSTTNNRFGGVISGSVRPMPYGDDKTPDAVALSHGGIAGNSALEKNGRPTLAKDSPDVGLRYNEAQVLPSSKLITSFFDW